MTLRSQTNLAAWTPRLKSVTGQNMAACSVVGRQSKVIRAVYCHPKGCGLMARNLS
jgi:hypothetical protein